MKSGLKILAIAALVAGTVGLTDQVQAACDDGLTAFYPVNQCGRGTWFAPPPPGAGTVSAAWWQVGFGNLTVKNGGAATGTGFQFGAGFIGNDSGRAAEDSTPPLPPGDPRGLDMADAGFVGGPAGSLCFSSAANWARPGIDGCADNQRTGNGPYGYPKNDNILNPYFASGVPGGAGVGLYTRAYLLDAPMMALLTESSNQFFSFACFASDNRGASATDVDPGQFDMLDIVNGDLNPSTTGPSVGRSNVIPWQPIPNPLIAATFADPNNPTTSPRMLNFTWSAVRFVSDNSNRPSPDTTLGGATGVGCLNYGGAGALVQHAIETAAAQSGGGCGAFSTALSVPAGQTTATLTVPADTCVRFRTHLGRVPEALTPSLATAAPGRLGDLGSEVFSQTVVVGGALSSSSIRIDSVESVRNVYRISFSTTSELNASTFDVVGIDNRGGRTVLTSAPCAACNSGLGSSYVVEVPKSSLKGAKTVVVVMQPSGTESSPVSLK